MNAISRRLLMTSMAATAVAVKVHAPGAVRDVHVPEAVRGQNMVQGQFTGPCTGLRSPLIPGVRTPVDGCADEYLEKLARKRMEIIRRKEESGGWLYAHADRFSSPLLR